jgi:hypothetical protein
MNATSTPLGLDFPKQVVEMMFQSFEDGSKWAARMLWDVLMTFLTENWVWVFLGLLAIFIFVLLKAMLGRWGSLGSFLYHFFYFGTLFIVGLIWGPEVFTEDIFNALCAVILYPVCYLLVGIILDRTGLKSNR